VSLDAAPGAARAPAGASGPAYDPRLSRCPLCGQAALREFDRDDEGHVIDRCGGCGVKLLNPQYSDEWLRHFYAGYTTPLGDHDGKWRKQPEVRRAGKTKALEWIARHGRKGRILMVGCGDGLELLVARDLGWQPEGHDVDPATTAQVAAATGIPVHCGEFTALPFADGSFDAVFLDQVIEHPKNPGDFLRTAARVLAPGGILYLGLPNIGGLSNRGKTLLGRLGLKRRRRGRHYACKHHLFYYEPRVMARLLRRHYGFEVLGARGSPKPSRRGALGWFGDRLPFLDSSFRILARKPRGGS